MVDWSLARQVARFATGGDRAPDLGVDLAGMVADSLAQVSAYTGIDPGPGTPAPEAVGRTEWAEANLETLAHLIDPVVGRLDGRLDRAGPLAGALRAAGGATVAAECGLVISFMAQRVLGQYEVSLLQPDVPPRLLFVAPNLDKAVGELEVDRESFLHWIALHEVTHVVQFAGVPWLREHIGELLRRYLATVEVRIESGAAGGLPSLPNIQRIVDTFREGGLAALVQSREQRGIMEEVQAAMAVVEGYSEHVMDAIGADVIADHEGLRAAMTKRRRSRSAPERVLMRLLGLELKMRQYEQGKAFCDAVADEGGIELLNEVWAAPERLPSQAELTEPARWVERMRSAAAAA